MEAEWPSAFANIWFVNYLVGGAKRDLLPLAPLLIEGIILIIGNYDRRKAEGVQFILRSQAMGAAFV
jgi:predicted Abi (CAAX) family protease